MKYAKGRSHPVEGAVEQGNVRYQDVYFDVSDLAAELDLQGNLRLRFPVRDVDYAPLRTFLEQYEQVLDARDLDFISDELVDKLFRAEVVKLFAERCNRK